MHVKLIGVNARYTHSCLALFYLRNELEFHCSDINIELVQYTINDPYHQLLLMIMEGSPDYFFFSSAIWNSEILGRLIADLLKVDPESFCVVGGPQAGVISKSIDNERCIAVLGQIEGVETGFYKDIHEKELKREYSCSDGQNTFSYPYRIEDFSTTLLNRHIYYESSRGCPFRCSYCLSASKQTVYHKPVDQVLEELDKILCMNPKEVRFIDRTFNDNINRALTIWKFLAEYECDTVFHFEIAPDRFTRETLTFLQGVDVGKFEFEIGIQSTNENTLSAIGRRVNLKNAASSISSLRKMNNIHLHVDLILGLPCEDEGSFLESFRYVFDVDPHYIQMGWLKILPDTPIFREVLEHGYIYGGSPPYSVYRSKWMDSHTIKKLYWFGECVERFVNNRYFVCFWSYLRRAEVDSVSFFLQLLDYCHEQNFFMKAPTQELLSSLLVQCISDWSDKELVIELLRYDWLRCGHRYLPSHLAVKEEDNSRFVKRKLFKNKTEQMSCFSGAELNYMFKKGYFMQFSGDAVLHLGYERCDDLCYVCFLPERDTTLYKHNRTILFTLPFQDH